MSFRYGARVSDLIDSGALSPPPKAPGSQSRLGLRFREAYHRVRMRTATHAAYLNARIRDPQNQLDRNRAQIRASEQAKVAVSEYDKMTAIRKELRRKPGGGGGEVHVRAYTRSKPSR